MKKLTIATLLSVSTYVSISNLVYGSVAAIIAFLAWAYLSSIIFLYGAFLSVSCYQIKQKQQNSDFIPGGYWPEPRNLNSWQQKHVLRTGGDKP